ncbi:hypothetical protein [Segatella copri]|uniref:hypothetical protein n=1 Tax=Segatella copri TaxID=165179 RepID=UPI001291407D|nr:hypothetical protein [Segatella copri]MCW4097240.1 hypothetical protein [Segatella copri]MQP19613.1 hypothetical protein [Segatella copri DSM 18205]UEA43270.1 hypothetical protein LK433_01395 [Segatella copri DSM 18205]UWP52121.1 hypothetical protein NQ544_12630 [Segatella copri DSM 18205]
MADFVLRLFYRIVARTKVYKSKSDYQEWKEKAQGRLSVDKTISPEPVFTSVRDKKCCHVLMIFVSQTFHQNPIGINTYCHRFFLGKCLREGEINKKKKVYPFAHCVEQ